MHNGLFRAGAHPKFAESGIRVDVHIELCPLVHQPHVQRRRVAVDEHGARDGRKHAAPEAAGVLLRRRALRL